MRRPTLPTLLAAASALACPGIPAAAAAPTATPPSDGGGYVGSTARCAAPDTAVLFGATQTSRVAICKTADGSFEYRGVRVSDGAKLIAPAKQVSDTSFVAGGGGVTYTVTPTALSVTAGGNTFRTETWTDFHGSQPARASAPGSAGVSPISPTAEPGPPGAATPQSAGAATPQSAGAAGPGLSTPAAPKAAPPSPPAPLPPPLPAEVGGSSGE